jgi:SpoVK/Ycf46/Vps4 family AAA+-type ATPase
LNGHIDRLVTYFNLGPPAIQRACLTLQGYGTDPALPETLPQKLWHACLAQARPRLGELAQHIPTAATWDDLVLPDKELQVLKTLTAHVRQRSTVYEQWGFARKGNRGLGISALFAGASGTGKTLAAEVIARELHLDLYRIDLSATISKYIGETEKNLRQIFDAAETGGAVLLFDEADALFGKRSEVTDARDRYANMEVAYLLQRIEAYRGLAILTTNLKDSLDQAFLRRIRFIVNFPFPDASQRELIWQLCFPPQTPTQGLNFKKLAKLSVAGGNIRNIALNAAFLAAEAGEPVGMHHLLQASQSEYIKLERPLTDPEVKGWVPNAETGKR